MSVIVGPSIKNLPRDKTGLAYLHDQADNKNNGWAAWHLGIAYCFGGWGTKQNVTKWDFYYKLALKLGISGHWANFIDNPKTWEEWNAFNESVQVDVIEKRFYGTGHKVMKSIFMDNYQTIVHENALISATLGSLFYKAKQFDICIMHYRNAMSQGCFLHEPDDIVIWYKPINEYWKFFLDYFPEKIVYRRTTDEKSMYLFAERYKMSLEHKNSVYATDYYRLYNRVNNRANVALRVWSLCGIRLGVMKDLRIYISKIIWASRKEVLPWVKPNYSKEENTTIWTQSGLK